MSGVCLFFFFLSFSYCHLAYFGRVAKMRFWEHFVMSQRESWGKMTLPIQVWALPSETTF